MNHLRARLKIPGLHSTSIWAKGPLRKCCGILEKHARDPSHDRPKVSFTQIQKLRRRPIFDSKLVVQEEMFQ